MKMIVGLLLLGLGMMAGGFLGLRVIVRSIPAVPKAEAPPIAFKHDEALRSFAVRPF